MKELDELRAETEKAYPHARLLDREQVLAMIDALEAAIELRGAAGFPYDSGFDDALSRLASVLSGKADGNV